MKLPTLIEPYVRPLLDAQPLSRAMPELVVTHDAGSQPLAQVAKIIQQPEIARRPPLIAGLWLYVDDLGASHKVSQSIDDATGSFWHGIMHRREGDFSNSRYWFNKAGRHPAMKLIEGYDAVELVAEVETAHARGESPAALVEMQRREWAALFEWCADAST